MCECQCVSSNKLDDVRIVSVLNYGAFISRVDLYYNYQGKEFNFFDFNLAVLQEFRVNVPIEATNVRLNVYVDDLFRGLYLLFKNIYSIADDACFLLWGFSFAAQYRPIPCTSPGVIQRIIPPGAIVPHPCICNDSCLICDDNCPKCDDSCSICNEKSLSKEYKCHIDSCLNNNIDVFRVQSQNIYD